MSDHEALAAHLARVGKRAGFSVWTTDTGFASRVDAKKGTSSPVFFESTFAAAFAKAATFARAELAK